MKLTLQQMRVFVTVNQYKNITKAAKYLHLSQPAVSKHLANMKAQVGFDFFEVINHQLSLTGQGKNLLTEIELVLQQVRHMEESVDRIKGLETGILNVSIGTGAQDKTMALIAKFKKRYPAILLKIKISERMQQVTDLAQNNVDLCILGEANKDKRFMFERLYDYDTVVATPLKHKLLKANKKLKVSDLFEETFVVGEKYCNSREVFDSTIGSQAREAIELNQENAVGYAIQVGLGIGMISTDIVKRAHNQVALLKVEGFPVKRYVCIAHHPKKILSPLAKEFIKFAKAESSKL